MDKPILLLMLMLMVSLYPSIDLAASIPKYLGILLGIVLFYAVVNTVQTRTEAAAAGWLLVALGVGVALVGLIGTNWQGAKFGLDNLTAQLPKLVRDVEASQRTLSGFHPNEVGGTLCLFLPTGLALTVGSSRWRAIALVASVLMALTLLVTQSRSAFIGTGVALLFLAGASQPKLLYGLPVLLLAAAAAVYAVGPEQLLDVLFPAQAESVVGSWESRAEVWQRAWYMIQDFPYTGVGLNTFPKVVALLYPLFLAPDASTITHAHNLYLQTAVDLGLPGLVAFMGILVGFYLSLWRAWQAQTNEPHTRALILGLAGGVLAHLVFGADGRGDTGGKAGGGAVGDVRPGRGAGEPPHPDVHHRKR